MLLIIDKKVNCSHSPYTSVYLNVLRHVVGSFKRIERVPPIGKLIFVYAPSGNVQH